MATGLGVNHGPEAHKSWAMRYEAVDAALPQKSNRHSMSVLPHDTSSTFLSNISAPRENLALPSAQKAVHDLDETSASTRPRCTTTLDAMLQMVCSSSSAAALAASSGDPSSLAPTVRAAHRLLRNGADPNSWCDLDPVETARSDVSLHGCARGTLWRSPLYQAYRCPDLHLELLSLLLAWGADPHLPAPEWGAAAAARSCYEEDLYDYGFAWEDDEEGGDEVVSIDRYSLLTCIMADCHCESCGTEEYSHRFIERVLCWRPVDGSVDPEVVSSYLRFAGYQGDEDECDDDDPAYPEVIEHIERFWNVLGVSEDGSVIVERKKSQHIAA